VTHPLAGRPDRGAAVAEFALVAALVCLLFGAVLQLGYALHVRNTATAHVIEGARAGARADAGPGAGIARARELLTTTVPGSGADVRAGRTVVGGVQVVEVSADLALPVVGPWGIPGTMTVTGHAFAEDQ
jgi:Flp pilus assembly protein TadG